ncbi:hypothetical protein THAOC_01122, partial [Thalassiosira oceanica]
NNCWGVWATWRTKGPDVYAGCIWKWADGNGDTNDRVYSREESDDLQDVKACDQLGPEDPDPGNARQVEGNEPVSGYGKGRRGGRADVHVWVPVQGQHVRTGLVIGTLQKCKDKLCIVEKALVLSSTALRQIQKTSNPKNVTWVL